MGPEVVVGQVQVQDVGRLTLEGATAARVRVEGANEGQLRRGDINPGVDETQVSAGKEVAPALTQKVQPRADLQLLGEYAGVVHVLVLDFAIGGEDGPLNGAVEALPEAADRVDFARFGEPLPA